MLSQRIIKRVLYTQNDLEKKNSIQSGAMDTLKNLLRQWKDAHRKLQLDTLTRKNSPVINAMLKDISIPMAAMVSACDAIIKDPHKSTVDEAVIIVSKHELTYLMKMEQIVSRLQLEAEQKLKNLKGVEWALAVTSAVILLMEFFLLFRPVMRDLIAVNKKYHEQNHELIATNEELTSTEEELRANLDFVSALKEEMSVREKQYREVVENATDMIYELGSDGRFSYVNPTLVSLSGFSEQELKQKYYWDLVASDFQGELRSYYKAQLHSRSENSYFEFPMITKSNKTIWVGQNVKMFFKDEWVEKVTVVARDITTLKEVQQRLQQSELLFRSISEQTSDVISIFNVNNEFTYVSPSIKHLLGYDQKELIGKRGIELVHPEDISSLSAPSEIGSAKNRHIVQQFRLRKKDGTYVWMEAVSNILEDEFGNVTGIQSINRDITQRKLSEDALRASEQRFKLLAENAPIGIYQTDTDGACTFVNRVWSEVAGLEREQALGDGWAQSIHPEDQAEVFSRWMQSTKANTDFDLEFRFQNPVSGIRLVKSNAVPFRPNGNYSGYIGTMTDITELREAQSKLAESEKLYRQLQENAQDLTALMDDHFRYVYVSSSAEYVFGYAITDILNVDIRHHIHPEDVSHFSLAAAKAKNDRETQHLEYRINQKDAGIIWLDSFIQPVFNTEGELTSFQITSRDVTFRKQAEAELEEAKQKAEAATKAKSQFLSMMSHEIRTPMNAIIGLTNLLLTDKPTPEQSERLRLLQYSGENLLAIINDILDLSKIEAGKIILENIDFDISTAVSNTVNLLRKKTEDKDIKLNFNWDEKLPRVVKGDQVRITQILTNLLSNAIKFTERGYVSLEVKSIKADDDSFFAEFKVTDTGIGIREDQLDNIFESFSQASSDTSRKFGGTGLGLTITKNLLSLMGSDINVSSILGVGSIFSFTLKLERGSLERGKQSKTDKIETSLAGAKILLVEDNRVNQIVASNFLKQWHVEIDFADDGTEAIGKIQSMEYHLVLMDLQMPNMDGYGATAIIRKLNGQYFQQIPIIALTADAMVEIREKVLAAGMNDFVTKPFNPVELKRTITTHLENFSSFKPFAKTKLNLEDYTMGDEELAKQLATLITKNLEELGNSLEESVKTKDAGCFRKAVHKMSTSLAIIDNAEFNEVIKRLKELLISGEPSAKGELQSTIDSFKMLEESIKHDLSNKT